jgi:hypothetical protein
MPSFGAISIALAMVSECFFLWWRSVARRALRKAQYNDFESSFVNRMTTGRYLKTGKITTETFRAEYYFVIITPSATPRPIPLES